MPKVKLRARAHTPRPGRPGRRAPRSSSEDELLLRDHGDARMVSAESAAGETGDDRYCLVTLDSDHPGFRDAAYRTRRNRIAQIALDHVRGRAVPDAPY